MNTEYSNNAIKKNEEISFHYNEIHRQCSEHTVIIILFELDIFLPFALVLYKKYAVEPEKLHPLPMIAQQQQIYKINL